MSNVISFMLVWSLLIASPTLPFDHSRNDSSLSAEFSHSFQDSILEAPSIHTSLSESDTNIVYSGTDTTFYTKNIFDQSDNGDQSHKSTELILENSMYLKTGADGLNNGNECWCYIGNEFIFSGTNTAATVYVKGDYNVHLKTVVFAMLMGASLAQYELVAEVYDMDEGSRVGAITIDSSRITGMLKKETRSDSFYEGIPVYFIKDHVYKVVLKAEAETKANLISHSSVDIYETPFSITLSSIDVGFE